MSDDLVQREFLIFKRGRGWYRPESQGYTSFKFDAGRYTAQEAENITHPNGLDGPREGMYYKHESDVSDFPSGRIEALEAEAREAYLQVLASDGQAQEAYAAQLKAEAERDALAEDIERLRKRVEAADRLAEQLQVMRLSPVGVTCDVADAYRAYRATEGQT